MTYSLYHAPNRCLLGSFGLTLFSDLSYSPSAHFTNLLFIYISGLLNGESITEKIRAEAQSKYDREIAIIFVNVKAILAKAESDSTEAYRRTIAKYPELAITLKKDWISRSFTIKQNDIDYESRSLTYGYSLYHFNMRRSHHG